MLRYLCAGAFALSAVPAAAVTIDFQDLAPDLYPAPIVYPEATFSAQGTGTLLILGAPLNFLCSLEDFGCSGDIAVDFLGDPFYATNLSFNVHGDNGVDTGDVTVYGIGGALLGSQAFVLDQDPDTYDLQDLAGFGAISRIVLSPIDPSALSFDDFTFDIPVIDASAPAALALFGLGALALAVRRR